MSEGEAGALRCPSCGAWVPAQARECGHCRVEIASVRCARCFALHHAGASVCSRCGATLGLEAHLGPTDRRCPACDDGGTLIAVELQEHRIEECPRCTGVFVDHTTLERISHKAEAERGVRARPPITQRLGFATGPLRYRKCPVCADVMTRKNFGERSGVIVDVCTTDGVWFDAEELTRILEFVLSGGLDSTRLAAAERERTERIRKRLEAAPLEPPPPQNTSVITDIAQLIVDLIAIT